MYRQVVLLTAAAALLASPASADPGPADPDGVTQVAAAVPVAETGPAAEAPPVADGKVASSPPSTSTMDGVTLTISARDETQMSVLPLTTAISTREYAVGGVFDGSITGSATRPEGIFDFMNGIGAHEVIIEHDDRAPEEDGLNVLDLLDNARADDERARGAGEPGEPEQAVALRALLRATPDQEQRCSRCRECGTQRWRAQQARA
jgi:hypothetical protein